MNPFDFAFSYLIEKQMPTPDQIRAYILMNQNSTHPAIRQSVEDIYAWMTSSLSGREPGPFPKMYDMHELDNLNAAARARADYIPETPIVDFEGEEEAGMRMTPAGMLAPIPVEQPRARLRGRPPNPFKGERGTFMDINFDDPDNVERAERVERRERRVSPQPFGRGENMGGPQLWDDFKLPEGEVSLGSGPRPPMNQPDPPNMDPSRRKLDFSKPPNPFRNAGSDKKAGSPMDLAFQFLKEASEDDDDDVDYEEVMRELERDRQREKKLREGVDPEEDEDEVDDIYMPPEEPEAPPKNPFKLGKSDAMSLAFDVLKKRYAYPEPHPGREHEIYDQDLRDMETLTEPDLDDMSYERGRAYDTASNRQDIMRQIAMDRARQEAIARIGMAQPGVVEAEDILDPQNMPPARQPVPPDFRMRERGTLMNHGTPSDATMNYPVAAGPPRMPRDDVDNPYYI